MAIRDRNRPPEHRDPDNQAARLRGWYLLALYGLFAPFSAMLALLALAWRSWLTALEREALNIDIMVAVGGMTSLLCAYAALMMGRALRKRTLLPEPDFMALVAILATMILAMRLFDGL